MNDEATSKKALDLIARLTKAMEDQKRLAIQYEGAIEGVKLFMEELQKDAAKPAEEIKE